jgi:hypothetical protein
MYVRSLQSARRQNVDHFAFEKPESRDSARGWPQSFPSRRLRGIAPWMSAFCGCDDQWRRFQIAPARRPGGDIAAGQTCAIPSNQW